MCHIEDCYKFIILVSYIFLKMYLHRDQTIALCSVSFSDELEYSKDRIWITLLFADFQILTQDSENQWQC
jgi:hypothetical protein